MEITTNKVERRARFLTDNRAASAIEMAILLPLFILIILGVIEFGYYFVKYQIANRAISNISDTVQQDPDGATHELAAQEGLSILDLVTPPNFICTKAYADIVSANAGLCNIGDWNTAAPPGVDSDEPYFVAIRAFAKHEPLTPLTEFSSVILPDFDLKVVVQVSPPSDQFEGTVLFKAYTIGPGAETYDLTPYVEDGAKVIIINGHCAGGPGTSSYVAYEFTDSFGRGLYSYNGSAPVVPAVCSSGSSTTAIDASIFSLIPTKARNVKIHRYLTGPPPFQAPVSLLLIIK